MVGMRVEPTWQEREKALMWGAPLVLFAALAVDPVTISLIIDPAFAHARWFGCALIPIIGVGIVAGLNCLAVCFRSDFDVLTFFAGGTAVVLVVIAMCEGVILASVVGSL